VHVRICVRRAQKTFWVFELVALVAAAIAVPALAVSGQAPASSAPPAGTPPAAQAPPRETLTALNPPKNTIYIASGSTGSNNGIILGSDGVILIDTGITTGSESAELAELAKITTKPVTTAILSHSDADHVNGLAVLPMGITIIAQVNCKAEMEKAAAAPLQGPPSAAPALKIPLPTKTVDTQEDITIGGERLHLFHVAPAHTSGDLVVYLPAEKIVFTGDIIADNNPFPIIHAEKNGSSQGWIQTVTALVALDADMFVPGHGTVHNKADIVKLLASVKDRRAQIQALVAQGKSLDDIKQQFGETTPAPAVGARGLHFPSFTEVVYKELTAKN
jgi:glyoxylase-like metal-dependent hydrolase (beta-lactamase superfamily II)